MIHPRRIFVALALSAAVHAQGTVQISIGIRETQAGGGAFTAIGANGGSAGGIEFVARDVQTLILDGTWQQFTFNITTDPLTAFAGTTANGILDGTYGVLENVRVLNNTGITEPISLWIDDVTNTTTPGGPVNFGDFDSYGAGTEVMFQEPSFSGSTSANLVAGSTTGVDTRVASRSTSDRFNFQFIDGQTTRWVRLTTFNTTILPNPSIRFDNQSVVTFWLRGGTAQEDVGSQGPGAAFAEAVGTGLNTGESSIYYTAGAPANVPGVLAISLFGQPDLPIFGGNLVSGFGLAATVSIGSDANGRFNLLLPGLTGASDLALQSVFLDISLPQSLTFTNALRARFGQ